MLDSIASRIVLPADCVCGNFQHQNKGDICGFISNILHAQLFSGICLSPNIAFVPGRFSDPMACPALSRKWRHMGRLATRKGYIINPALSLYSLKILCSQPRLLEKLPQARRREWKAQPLYVHFTVHTLRHKTFSIADCGQNVKAFGWNFYEVAVMRPHLLYIIRSNVWTQSKRSRDARGVNSRHTLKFLRNNKL